MMYFLKQPVVNENATTILFSIIEQLSHMDSSFMRNLGSYRGASCSSSRCARFLRKQKDFQGISVKTIGFLASMYESFKE